MVAGAGERVMAVAPPSPALSADAVAGLHSGDPVPPFRWWSVPAAVALAASPRVG